MCNSATLGLIPQNAYFDREIANSNNTEGYYVIEYGDFVYNPRKSVSAPYGPVNIYTGSIKGIISPLYLCFSVHSIMPSFLYYRFKSSVWFSYVYSHGDTGTRFDRVSIKDDVFFEMPIYMPSSKEQIKIANLMALLDERIATQNKIIDKLQTLIKGLSNKIFESLQGQECRLGDIATITNGNSNVQDAITEYKDDLYPFFDRSEEIKYLPTFLFDKEAIIYPGEGAEFFPRYFNGKFALHQRCYAIFDFNKAVNPQFLYCFLKTQNSYFIRNAVGSTVPSLRLDTFQKLKVVVPSKETQSIVSSLLFTLEKKHNTEKMLLQTLLKQKHYLLRQMFI